MARKKIIAGNWKMNMTPSEAVKLVETLKPLVVNDEVDVVFCVPAIDIIPVVEAAKGTNIQVGAENMYFEEKGAYTGEISPAMLVDAGVKYVVLGHSERREYFKESDEFINEKVKAVLAAGMLPILCIGEKLEERESGKTAEVTETQIRGGLKDLTAEEAKKVIVAYEPVWAIGTGRTATPEMAQETHRQVRDVLVSMFGNETAEEMIIQYGGSMKPDNAVELLAQKDIDGGLIGGASLKASSFAEIVVAGK